MAKFFREFTNSLKEPNQCVDPDAGQPNQSDPAGTLQVPEITIVGDPRLGQAYQIGFANGQAGFPSARRALEGSAELVAEYDKGFWDGSNAPRRPREEPRDQEPSIRQATPEEAEASRHSLKPFKEDSGDDGENGELGTGDKLVVGGAKRAVFSAPAKVVTKLNPAFKNPGFGPFRASSLPQQVAEIATGCGDTHCPEAPPKWVRYCKCDDEPFGPWRATREEAQGDADEHNRTFPGHQAVVTRSGWSTIPTARDCPPHTHTDSPDAGESDATVNKPDATLGGVSQSPANSSQAGNGDGESSQAPASSPQPADGDGGVCRPPANSSQPTNGD